MRWPWRLENLAAGEPAQQRRAHPGRVHAAPARERERLGHGFNRHRGHHPVTGLGHLAGAVVADVHDILAHRLETRLHAREYLGLATDHDGKGR